MYHCQIAQGRESAIQTMLEHSIHCTWNKQQFPGECHKLQRPWASLRTESGLRWREARALSFSAIKHVYNFYSGCHRDARGRWIPRVCKMNDASTGRRQASAAVVWATCLPGRLQRVPNPLSPHQGGLEILEHTEESLQCPRIGSKACSCMAEADNTYGLPAKQVVHAPPPTRPPVVN